MPRADTTDQDRLRLCSDTWESLFRTQVTIIGRLVADDVWIELTAHEYDVLFTLVRAPSGGLRLRDLTNQVLLTQSSLSRMTERLESRGLVTRGTPADDGRGTFVTITDHGRELQRAVARRHVRSITHYLGAMDDDALEQLGVLLEKLRRSQDTIKDAEPARDARQVTRQS